MRTLRARALEQWLDLDEAIRAGEVLVDGTWRRTRGSRVRAHSAVVLREEQPLPQETIPTSTAGPLPPPRRA